LGSEIQENVAEDSCYIDHIAVEDKFRGKGVGRLLVEKAEYEAKHHGSKVISYLT